MGKKHVVVWNAGGFKSVGFRLVEAILHAFRLTARFVQTGIFDVPALPNLQEQETVASDQ